MAGPTRYVYEPPWPAYALAWAVRSEPRFRFAVGSCNEQDKNFVQVVELNEETKRLELRAEIEHPFPPTKLMWKPSDSSMTSASAVFDGSLLASSSTVPELWRYEDGQIKSLGKMPAARTQCGQQPPLTSFDWSVVNEHKLAGASVDTTCSIWNIERQKIETQLIAHDKAVYDVAFGQRESIASMFASVGADGSVRVFDQRNLEHSTIIYETSPPTPLLRLAWNRNDKNYIATIAADQVGVIILDIRRPSVAFKELSAHGCCTNAVTWAPHSKNHLICGTEDGTALIWDVHDSSADSKEPKVAAEASILAYEGSGEIYQAQWPESQPDYIALGMARQVEVLRI